MHVCFVNLHHPPDAADPDALVAADVTRRGFGAALVARGHRVTVVQEAPWRARVERDGVVWELVPPSAVTLASRRAFALAGHLSPRVPAPATSVLPVVEALRPDVIHSFDLVFYPSLALLGRLSRRLTIPLVAHFHGGAPARRPGYRHLARYALARTDRALFTTAERGAAWVRAGLLAEGRVAELVETSTFFRLRDRATARARTGLHGDPLYVCAGRLDAVKDPLTTLDGFARIARHRPGARLVMTWTDAPLLPAVARRVVSDPVLAPRVDLRGPVAHADMESLLASADYLLQSSVREVCGVVVLEALACGVAPVLTDIPPFRRLTDEGRVGALFPRGDAVALAAQALALADGDRAAQARAAAARFDAALAFPALAAELEAIYRGVIGGPKGRW